MEQTDPTLFVEVAMGDNTIKRVLIDNGSSLK